MNTSIERGPCVPGALDQQPSENVHTPLGTGNLGFGPVAGPSSEVQARPGVSGDAQDSDAQTGSSLLPSLGSTDDVRLAAVNAALWLREETQQRGLLSLTAGFREGLTVIYRDGAGATVLLAGSPPVTLDEAALDSELDAWAVPA